MDEQTLVPKLNPGFIIPLTKDQLDRSKLTLKELRELAKAKGISILGPKGGYLTKQPLLKKVEEFFEEEEKEKQAELKAKQDIIIQHNNEIIEQKTNLWKNKKKQVTKLRRQQQIINEQANELEREMQEIRVLISSLKHETESFYIK
tara:strand:- start:390 stop:830 length:441 start_codon:yes stop_codon:yes gene_type:complete